MAPDPRSVVVASSRRGVFGVLVLWMLVIPRVADAQVSLFLKKGTSGYGGYAGLSTTSGATGFELGGGYSYEGRLEVGLMLGRVAFDMSRFQGADVAGYTAGPTFEYHPLK